MKICMVLHKYGVSINDPCCYPLGYMYVSSFFKKSGHEVKVLNYNLFDYDLEKEIVGYDLVTFTGFEEFLSRIRRDAELCHKLGVKTMVGGALATFRPKEMAAYCDYVHSGYIDHMGLYPDYDGFGINEYHKRHGLRYMGVLTSFGCPYHCSFCSSTGQFYPRNLDDVSGEILTYLVKYDTEIIVFNDNTFNFSKKRYMDLCRKLKIYGLKWCAAIRADIFDEQMAEMAVESGCKYLVVGVESFRQDKLNRMQKGLKVESILSCLELLERYGIPYHGNVLVGFEGETIEDIRSEVSEIPSTYNIFPTLVQPFVGTRDGRRRSISKLDEGILTREFNEIVTGRGYYQFPAVEWT